MFKAKVGKVEVIVRGESENIVVALTGLLQQSDEREIKEALTKVENTKLVRIASLIHGRLYRRLLGQE